MEKNAPYISIHKKEMYKIINTWNISKLSKQEYHKDLWNINYNKPLDQACVCSDLSTMEKKKKHNWLGGNGGLDGTREFFFSMTLTIYEKLSDLVENVSVVNIIWFQGDGDS